MGAEGAEGAVVEAGGVDAVAEADADAEAAEVMPMEAREGARV